MAENRTGILIAAGFMVAVWGLYAVIYVMDEDRVQSTWRSFSFDDHSTGPHTTAPEPAPPRQVVEPAEERFDDVRGLRRIGEGMPLDIADYAVSEKTTIFVFHSDYCPPCNAIAPRLGALAARRDDIVAVEVNVDRGASGRIDWNSPLARQYDLHSIPHFVIYDSNGRVMAEGRQARTLVEQWMAE